MQPAAVSEIRTEDVEQLMMPASLPKSRGRHDSLPEYARYRDDGCDISESCLTCPLPRCRYEEPGACALCSTRRATGRSSSCA